MDSVYRKTGKGQEAIAQRAHGVVGRARSLLILVDGQRPQVVIPRGQWQAAQSLGNWTLVGCTVAPGFDFKHFEMAEEDWKPGQS